MRKALAWVAVAVTWTWVVAGAAEPSLTFKKHGQVVKTYTLSELKQLIPSKSYMIYEPHEDKDVAFQGFPLNDILQKVYGSDLKSGEELLFTCTDGYQPSLPAAKFAKYLSYLAFERKGDPKFTLINTFNNNKVVSLAPFYLLWDNVKSPELKEDGAEDWPYQLVAVDLISFSERFPNLAPPQKATAEAKRGFLVFRKKCATCHTVNGAGGGKAPELNYPVSVTEYMKESWLKKWISDPSSVRYQTPMPAINKEAKDWKRDVDDVVEYLKAMVENKKAPVAK